MNNFLYVYADSVPRVEGVYPASDAEGDLLNAQHSQEDCQGWHVPSVRVQIAEGTDPGTAARILGKLAAWLQDKESGLMDLARPDMWDFKTTLPRWRKTSIEACKLDYGPF